MCQAHPSPGWGPAPRIRVGDLPSLPDSLVTLFSGGGGVPPSADLFCARLVSRGESPPPALLIVLLLCGRRDPSPLPSSVVCCECGGRDPSPAGAPLALVTLFLLQYRAAGRSVFLGLLEVLEKAENPNLSSGFECCTSGT